MKGYTEKILEINLGTKEVRTIKLDDEFYEEYLGGSGLAARVLYNQMPDPKSIDPLGLENILVFMTGPFTATKIPCSGRLAVCAKSPLTDIWGESNIGGKFAVQLKKAGWDGIIITGISRNPVYIFIENEKVEIKDAWDLWGLDTYQIQERLSQEILNASVACIGQAGENLVKFASIMFEGKSARAAGRCGLGAVMGSKKLKAIVTKGNAFELEIADERKVRELGREIAKELVKNSLALRKYGTGVGMKAFEKRGKLPIKNWQKGSFEGARNISGQALVEKFQPKDYYCASCVIGCGKEIESEELGLTGAAPEYETCAMLGALCEIDDLVKISKANQLCNQYGLDTISTGAVIAFLMEAYEKNLLLPEYCRELKPTGIEPTWGNAEVLTELIHRIGKREGSLGKLLGEGVRTAAKKLGPRASGFAIEVKGLELPAHDPRAVYSMAAGYATSNRGACHLQGFTYGFEESVTMPELGYLQILDPHIPEEKGILNAKMQDLMCIFDSLSVCKFAIYGGLRPNHLVELLNGVTGWNLKLEEMMKIGERIFNLKRLFNVRCGISKKDDTLPTRILTQPRGSGGAADTLPDLETMLKEYYRYRGWNEKGVPKPRKLKELNLR